MNAKDRENLSLIISYCEDVIYAVARFGDEEEEFINDKFYQYCTSFCIMQVGECVKRLSEEFKAGHPDVPWKAASGTRDRYSHDYGHADTHRAWLTVSRDIPAFLESCRKIMDSEA